MPLPNRVSPFGELVASPGRGTLMGNRGGRLHDAQRKLTARRWVNRAWICCRLEFKDRHRDVWSDSYTELFFLDEVTAFAAGHRPCFECRRKDAEQFAILFSGKKKTRQGCSHGSYPPCRAAVRQGQARSSIGDRRIAGWRDDRASWRSIGCARRKAFAVESLRLLAAKATPARHRSRRAHAAVDPRRARA
jgi:hypothetical protein